MIRCIRCSHEVHNGFCEEDSCGCDQDNFSDLLGCVEELEAELKVLRDVYGNSVG
jgi:hypothetical protein